jgi:peptidyl-prolyl cis-trans isomerase C
MHLARRLLREPLLHFALLGALLIALQTRYAASSGRRIVVDASTLRGLRQDFLRRTGAPPDAAEEAALVEQYLDNEVLVREALALGLDRGDVIVRRRLVQKMEFLAEALDAPAQASDTDLEGYLRSHSERYAIAPRIALTHVFLANQRHGAGAGAEAAALAARAALLAGAAPRDLGDPFPRGAAIGASTERELAGIFGPAFAAQAMQLPVGEWSAPLRSSYGFHLVRIESRTPGETPALAAVRPAVKRDFDEEQRAARRRAALDQLRGRYDIRVEGEKP